MELPPADLPDKEPDFSLLCYLQIWLRSPLLMLPRGVMADQDSLSPTTIAVTLHHGLAVQSIMESHSGGWRYRRNSPRGVIFYLCLPNNDEADE
jgi:hypothetical protein